MPSRGRLRCPLLYHRLSRVRERVDGKKEVFRDCSTLPEGATTEDFTFHIHSDIGERLFHRTDCRSGQQVGKGNELTHRDVIELILTKQVAP
ncbi:TGS domain-containing protein [Halorubrum sp. BOL3-1]|uniref:TGS domain-containing protein n=1 Tax=Halorubrum sp. BOL3-1 TaxID=2497325 RepID=UPI001F4F6E1D|nr:TGS domain-containing protein [Halorubrum sp. BOL3-1]